MNLAIIPLKDKSLPGGNTFSTLHGYWIPPPYVIEFWSTGAKVIFINDSIYEQQKIEVQDSHNKCISKFWKEYVL